MKKGKLLLILASTCAASLGATLVSCGSNSSVANAGEAFKLLSIDDLKANSSEEAKITVSFWHSFGHNISQHLDKLINDFEKDMAKEGIYIDVDAKSVGGGYDGLRSRVNLGTKSNSIPTMVLGYPDHFADYIDSNILLSLNDFANSSDARIGLNGDYAKEDFIDSYWNENQLDVNGDGVKDIAGIPFNKSTEIMYYNASAVDPILAANGWLSEDGYWDKPTWDQVATVSSELIRKVNSSEGLKWKYKTDGVTPIEYSSEKTVYPVYIDSGANSFITTARQWATPDTATSVYTTVENGKGVVTFNNDTTKAAQAYFLERANNIPSDVSSTTSKGLWNLPDKVNQSYGSNLMVNNEAFISIGSTAGVGNNDSEQYEMKCTTMPQKSYEEGSVQSVIQQGTNCAILTENSNNLTRLSAWLLIRYLTSTEKTSEFSQKTGYLPVRESAKNSESFQAFLSDEEDIFRGPQAKAINAAYKELDYFYTDPAFSGSSIVRDEVDTMMQSIYCQGKPVADAMKTAYANISDLGIAVR